MATKSMNTGPLIEALLQNQGLAVFTHAGDGRFRPIGNFPAWLVEIGGANPAPDGTLQLGERFPFVENFLIEAQQLWKAESAEHKNSGLWIEKGAGGRELALEASALWLLGMPILILRNPQESYQDQTRWLQTARQSRLKHDRLGREIQKKEILLHCIVHDLSQPLSAMRGCFSCLNLEAQPGAIHKLIETGLKQSRLQENMIREILDAFSEELAGQPGSLQKPSASPDIAVNAVEVVKDYTAAFEDKGVRIEFDPDVDRSRDWKVVGDDSRLRRVFANLVENSLRVSPPNTTVIIGVIDEDRFVRAFVDDEGPGFPDGQAPQFSLLGKGPEHGGKAGLGLYFCRITVEGWGGTIGCEQRATGGARFWFRLPRAGQEPKTAVAPVNLKARTGASSLRSEQTGSTAGSSAESGIGARQNEARKPMESTWRPLRVLLAEDTVVNQELMTIMLEKRGHSLIAVANGREVLRALERESFDLVLMDQEMPELNGTETTKAIRDKERETGKHLPIVGVTGVAAMGGRDICLAAGMDACLPKPFQVQELYETIEGLIFVPGAIARAGGGPVDSGAANKTPLNYLSGNKKFVRRLVGVFLVDSAKRLAEIRRAVSRRDAEKLASLAHALAGSVGVFDAKSVADASRKLEAMGRSADFNGIDAAFDLLAQEYVKLRAQLRGLLSQSEGSAKEPGRKKLRRPVHQKRRK
jgi:signal transduction histidine kinase/HPt (histidine-containing phosphotransfer) domain-containing protein/ActR/RegA family two-component response regulator